MRFLTPWVLCWKKKWKTALTLCHPPMLLVCTKMLSTQGVKHLLFSVYLTSVFEKEWASVASTNITFCINFYSTIKSQSTASTRLSTYASWLQTHRHSPWSGIGPPSSELVKIAFCCTWQAEPLILNDACQTFDLNLWPLVLTRPLTFTSKPGKWWQRVNRKKCLFTKEARYMPKSSSEANSFGKTGGWIW